jgi:hypothetical protein
MLDERHEPIVCRLCGGEAKHRFTLKLIQKYDVGYYCCTRCEALQTEMPYWLDEVYKDPRRLLDTGAAFRNQKNQRIVFFLGRLFRFRADDKVLDWGGGDGLYVRMLRDIGFDAYYYDRYATNFYAPYFHAERDDSFKLITAFEVYEHLVHPGEELSELFGRKPDIHLLSTQLYTGQGPDWEYLWPVMGQHVFFHSPRSMRWVAEKYGYQVLSGKANYTIFYKTPLSAVRTRILQALLDGWKTRVRDTLYALARKDNRLIVRDRARIVADLEASPPQ